VPARRPRGQDVSVPVAGATAEGPGGWEVAGGSMRP
jgi:hypothetical protein